MTVVHMIGNAHIDPVWLWDWPAGVDEVLATFRSAADRCDEYPEFVFTRGEAWCYKQVEELDPELFERVRRHVAGGRWHVTGGQWVQPDVNLPTWAGLRRQIAHGRRYFRDRFGVTPDVGYNVDSFGHPATLPDLLAGEGYRGYVFHRPSQKQTALPAATFRWRGVGGGEVLGYRIPKPYVTRTHDLYGQVMLAADAADHDLGHVMCFYGVGNHGGGPTKGNIEYVLEHARAFDGLELRFSTPQAFFDAVGEKRDALPVVDFELQGTFPGCYVVMSEIKREQHRGEHRLEQTAAVIDQFAEDDHKVDLHAKLDAAWEDLLFTEFHDILAGTSIRPAWADVRGRQGRARVAAREVAVAVTRRHAARALPVVNHQQIVLHNPGDSPFAGLIEHEAFLDFDAWGDRWLSDLDGNAIDFQHAQPQSTIMLTPAVLFPAEVPAGEARIILVRDDARPAADVASDLSATETTLGNGRVALKVGKNGIESLAIDGRPMLGRGGLTLRLREDSADTWGFHIDRFDEPIVGDGPSFAWRVAETGPLRATLRGEGRIGDSRVTLTIALHRGEPTVYLALDVLFAERFKLLQLAAALPDPVRDWRAGLAGGAVGRDASSIEWPMHGWGRFGPLAVVTPDAYGASCAGEEFAWSLLRGTRMAWSGQDAAVHTGRNDFADQGEHTFEFRLRPAADDATLAAEAAAMARPPIVFDRYTGMNRPPWGDSPPRRMWTGAEQRARRDGRMGHLRDSGGTSVEEQGPENLPNPTVG